MGKNLTWAGSGKKIPEHEPIQKKNGVQETEEDLVLDLDKEKLVPNPLSSVLEKYDGTRRRRSYARRRRRRRRKPILSGALIATLAMFALAAFVISNTGDLILGLIIVGAGWIGWNLFGGDPFSDVWR